MEKILAIYDSDAMYATRFMEFFNKRNDFNFEISAFTRKDSLEEYVKQQKIEILLFGDGLDLKELAIENIKYIYELSDNPRSAKDKNCPSIFKYQAAKDIMAEVISEYARRENVADEHLGIGVMQVISVFTPIPDIGALAFAWSFAMILSEKKKVLFIPMDLLPVSMLSSKDASNQGLSELIYYLKENNPNIITKMKELLCYTGRLSYLCGLTQGLDLLSLGKEDICKWVEELKAHTDYDVVIFYLGIYTEFMVEILKQSQVVLISEFQIPYHNEVIKEWERQMDFLGIPMDQTKFQKLYIPIEEWPAGKITSVLELHGKEVWSEAKKYAENI